MQLLLALITILNIACAYFPSKLKVRLMELPAAICGPKATARTEIGRSFLSKNTKMRAKIESDEFEIASSWKVSEGGEVRIDVFLLEADSERFPSAKAAKKSVRKGLITVNGNVTSRIDACVAKGDLVEYHCRVSRASYIPAFVDASATNDNILHSMEAAKVLLENDYLAVMKKPAGCTFDEMNSISLMALKPPSTEIRELLRRPQVVHRLDRPVAGVLLLAKTSPSLRGLSNLFLERRVDKTYLALVAGKVGPKGFSQIIDIPLEKKSSITRIEVERVDACALSHDGYVTTLRVFPETGRNHQIRKHLSYSGWPIICDDKYWFKETKPDPEEKAKEQCWREVHQSLLAQYSGNRIALMSTRIEFTIPKESGFPSEMQGERVVVESEPTEVSEVRDMLLNYSPISSNGNSNGERKRKVEE